ncbi:hypothetical protein OSB04_021101 [Centaurea solstitialis]|uniref:Auxin-responsive protein n=1 Tax=Centaurea solstitialis TaxID=347529 RepID=A0AA38TD94_9ASTR|nr:hypothetical protein OSB04_021101 [Centaurea solstitialis]
MELHLGLALSSSSSSSPSQFDLNNYTHESNNIPIHHHLKKRKNDGDGDGDGDFHVPETLPLLVWNNLCNKNQLNLNKEDQDDHYHVGDNEVESNSIFVHQRNDVGVIGWPPVKSCRKMNCHPKVNGSKSMYVKVWMEGMGIARKVDLNGHHSYKTLVHTLAKMFGKCYEDVKLTYQDKDGDWLLAGDVPWGSFVETIQRLKLLKK